MLTGARRKDTLLQTSPAQTKKHQEGADRSMKEHLEEEDKDSVTVVSVSQKQKQAKGKGKERRREAAEGQDGSHKEEHVEEQKDTERTEAKTVFEKNKTDSVAHRRTEGYGEDRGKGCF